MRVMRICVLLATVAACGSEAPAPDSAAAATVAAVTRDSASCAAPAPAPFTPAAVGAATFVVNRATRGMAATIRWLVSADRAAMLVVEDPAGVENEAIPDGALFASERTGRTWRMDSVWSVSPSPDWQRVAFGRGVVLRNGESDSIPAAQWAAASQSLSAVAGARPALHADSLRGAAFPVSAMTYALGAAATFVAGVGADSAQFPVSFVGLGGWSVRWECAGGVTKPVIGANPARVQDDDPADAPGQEWVRGPVLHLSAPLSRDSVRQMLAGEREIEGRGGIIRVRDARGVWRTVGPGVPLASTRGGRFILAVAPRTGARPHESPDHAVVYRVP